MPGPARGRILLATGIVIGTVIATWLFIDYRMQPPAPPAVAAPL
jgi:hypothetical protein